MGKRVTACSVEVYVCCFCCPCVCTIQFIFFAGCRRFLIELSCSCCCCWCCSIVIFVLKLNGNAIVFKRANLLQFSFIALSCRVLSTPPPFSLPSHLHLVVCHVIATCRSERDGQYGWEWDSCVKIKDAFFLNFQLTFLCFTRSWINLCLGNKHRAITPNFLLIQVISRKKNWGDLLRVQEYLRYT